MTNILVTGGAGYVGSHTSKALALAGMRPVVYDNLSRGHAEAVRWGPLEQGDIRDGARLREVAKKYKPQAVIHFAGLTYVGESVREPADYYDVNVSGTLALLAMMREQGIKKFIFSSTCAVYGIPHRVPIAEDAATRPINPYGHSKLMAERILADYGAAYGLKSLSLRYFNAAGADHEGEIGEAHDPETHLIPLVLEAALRGTTVGVYGTDYETQDGTCVRDYIHVSDLADAHVRALKAIDGPLDGLALNLGTGKGVSVAEIISAARAITGREIGVSHRERRQGDSPVLVADAGAAKKTLEWVPSRSGIENILKTAWKWTLQRSAAATR